MLAAKQQALKAINKLPEDVNIDEIMYQLYIVDKIRKGQEDVATGTLCVPKQCTIIRIV